MLTYVIRADTFCQMVLIRSDTVSLLGVELTLIQIHALVWTRLLTHPLLPTHTPME